MKGMRNNDNGDEWNTVIMAITGITLMISAITTMEINAMTMMPAPKASRRPLATPAALGNHVGVLLEDHVVRLVVVQQGDGLELGGDAAGAATSALELPTEGGHDGVVGGRVVGLEGEGAAAVAGARLVAWGRRGMLVC